MRAAAMVTGLVAGGLLQVASTLTWYRAGTTNWTGAQLSNRLIGSLGWLVIVLVVLLLVLRTLGRRVVAVVLALLGAAAVITSLLSQRPSADELVASGHAVGVATGAVWVGVAAGLLTVLAAGVVFFTAPRWRGPRASQRSGSAPSETDLWRAQDLGHDPTMDEG